MLRATGIAPGDRVMLAYSFGPYIPFWGTYAGVQDVGAMVIPLGGMDSVQRLHTMREYIDELIESRLLLEVPLAGLPDAPRT